MQTQRNHKHISRIKQHNITFNVKIRFVRLKPKQH